MKRRCILIGAPGPRDQGDYLRGVSKDMHEMKSFLMSDIGGAWYDNEITTKVDISRNELRQLFNQNVGFDYVIILFSGHGGISSRDNHTYVELNPEGEEFDVYNFGNIADRELIIVDSCRSYFQPSYYIGLAATKEQRGRSPYRDLYDNLIAKSEKGSIFLYAASPHEAANETSNGGVFTQNLIAAGRSMEKDNRTNIWMPINNAFTEAEDKVISRYANQHPQMEGAIRRNYWFPFSVKI